MFYLGAHAKFQNRTFLLSDQLRKRKKRNNARWSGKKKINLFPWQLYLKGLEVATKHERDQNLENDDPKDLIQTLSSLPGLYGSIELEIRATNEVSIESDISLQSAH